MLTDSRTRPARVERREAPVLRDVLRERGEAASPPLGIAQAQMDFHGVRGAP